MSCPLPLDRALNLPELGWVGKHGDDRGNFDVALIEPIANGGNLPIKPLGGLWTSPVKRDDSGALASTAWTQWCDDNDVGPVARIVTIIEPDPTATVYVIDSFDDLVALSDAYHWSDSPYIDIFSRARSLWPLLDWPAVALDMDAIYLTDDGEWKTRFTFPGLNGWDCATVPWLQPRVGRGALIEELPVRTRESWLDFRPGGRRGRHAPSVVMVVCSSRWRPCAGARSTRSPTSNPCALAAIRRGSRRARPARPRGGSNRPATRSRNG